MSKPIGSDSALDHWRNLTHGNQKCEWSANMTTVLSRFWQKARDKIVFTVLYSRWIVRLGPYKLTHSCLERWIAKEIIGSDGELRPGYRPVFLLDHFVGGCPTFAHWRRHFEGRIEGFRVTGTEKFRLPRSLCSLTSSSVRTDNRERPENVSKFRSTTNKQHRIL